jgi:hypothetical protein
VKSKTEENTKLMRIAAGLSPRISTFDPRLVYVKFVVDKVAVGHNEDLHDLYSSPNTLRVIKSRRMKWAGHVARMGERRCVYKVWLENLRERDHLGDLGVDGRIIL